MTIHEIVTAKNQYKCTCEDEYIRNSCSEECDCCNYGVLIKDRINFIYPNYTKKNREAYSELVECTIWEYNYTQAKQHLDALGYYVSEDLYSTFKTLLNVATDLDIGNRRYEYD